MEGGGGERTARCNRLGGSVCWRTSQQKKEKKKEFQR